MSNVTKQLESILARAEAEVLELVAEAAAAGDYSSLDAARDTAGRLYALKKGMVPDSPPQEKRAKSPDVRSPVARTNRVSGNKGKARSKAGKPAGYPKYTIADGCLYKVAWSKKKKSEYSHRLPLKSASRFLDLIEELADSGEPVITEHCLQAVSALADPLPVYQFYIVLGLLKDLEVVHPAGRDGFSLDANWRITAERFIRQGSAEKIEAP